MNNFNLYSQYYNLLYQDKDTYKECEYVIDLLQQYKVLDKKLLEFGAGSGRHGKVFEQMSWQWSGIERSESMTQLARAAGLQIHQGDIANTKLEGSFSVVLSLFHVVSYLTDNASLRATFQNAYQHLDTGGIFLFDVWYSPAVYFQQPEPRIKTVENEQIKVIRKATPTVDWNQNRVEVQYDIQVYAKVNAQVEHFTEIHAMRHFSLPELQLLADTIGFSWLHAEEWLTGKLPGTDTWGVCCLLKK